jgi:sec-independent protein translocase protein TatC
MAVTSWRLLRRRRRRLDDEGRMPLVEHLRELRSRLIKAVLGIVAGTVVAWFFYDDLFDLLRQPFDDFRASAEERGVVAPQLVFRGVTDAFFMQVKVSVTAGVILSCPIWLYQIWGFITPGLHRNERRWSLLFLGTAIPLFLGGIAVCYLVLPKGLQILLGFTPEGVANFPDVPTYLNFFIRMVLVFGLGFELPLFVVLLTAAGVVSWRTLRRWTRVMIFGVFVFAAVATPTGDPITMLFLAAPLLVLLAVALFVAWLIDRRRRRSLGEPDYDELDDDEASPLDDRPLPPRS